MARERLDRRYNVQEHWGSQRPMPPAWVAGQLRTLVQKPAYRMPPDKDHPHAEFCVPQVQSMLLIAKNLVDATGTNYVFRWKLDVGQGGARMSVILDALNTQQVSLAGESIGVDVFCEAIDSSFAFTPPNVTPVFGVTMADGNVQSGQATYTQGFTCGALSTLFIDVPSMATGWRIDSPDGDANDSLVAGVTFTIIATGSPTIYLGASLKPVQYSPGFIPLQGNARQIKVTNANAVSVRGVLQWGLDL